MVKSVCVCVCVCVSLSEFRFGALRLKSFNFSVFMSIILNYEIFAHPVHYIIRNYIKRIWAASQFCVHWIEVDWNAQHFLFIAMHTPHIRILCIYQLTLLGKIINRKRCKFLIENCISFAKLGWFKICSW